MTVLVLDGVASLGRACLIRGATLGVLHRKARCEIVRTPDTGPGLRALSRLHGVRPVAGASGPHHGALSRPTAPTSTQPPQRRSTPWSTEQDVSNGWRTTGACSRGRRPLYKRRGGSAETMNSVGSTASVNLGVAIVRRMAIAWLLADGGASLHSRLREMVWIWIDTAVGGRRSGGFSQPGRSLSPGGRSSTSARSWRRLEGSPVGEP